MLVNSNDFLSEILVKDETGGFQVVNDQVKATAPSAPVDGYADDVARAATLTAELARELALPALDETSERRLKNVVLAVLKGIRSPWQNQETLTKSAEVGGLGLAESLAEKIMAWLATKQKVVVLPKNYVAPIMVELSLPPQVEAAPAKPVESTVAPAPVKPVEAVKAPIKVFSENELEHEIAPPTPAVVAVPAKVSRAPQGLAALIGGAKVPPAKPVALDVNFKKAIAAAAPNLAKKTEILPEHHLRREVKPFVAAATAGEKAKNLLNQSKDKIVSGVKNAWPAKVAPSFPASKSFRPIVAPVSRDKITDIKAPSRLIGPVEELQNLRLVDWRRFNANPWLAALKIKEKIDLLAAQDFAKKIAATSAWRKSEVFRLYLALGKESLAQKIPLSQVVQNRQAKNQAFLTEKEFESLGKLSKMLE